jgi:hypothetical protein
MSQIADATHGHKNREASEARMQKAIARILPGKGTRSLWVLYELLTYKIPSRLTGGVRALRGGEPTKKRTPATRLVPRGRVLLRAGRGVRVS